MDSNKFINQEIKIYYVVNVDHCGIAVHLTRSDCEGFQEMLYIQCSGWDLLMIHCGMAVMRMGVLGVSVRKMKALPVKMETLTLIGKGRQN